MLCFQPQCTTEFDNFAKWIFTIFGPTKFCVEEKLSPHPGSSAFFLVLFEKKERERQGIVEGRSKWPSQQICCLIFLALFLLTRGLDLVGNGI